MNYVEKNIKVIINEKEEDLINGGTRTGTVKRNKGTATSDQAKEVLMYTIRCNETFFADIDSFKQFPFENCQFGLRFEFVPMQATINREKV